MELGEALRNTENLSKELTPLSSVACGATSFLWKEAINCGKAATFPFEPFEPSEVSEPSEPSAPKALSNGDTTTLSPKGCQT